LAVYAQVARHDFINFDDPDYVVTNPHVSSGLSAANIAWAFTHYHASNWHPLTWISHMVDVSLFGLDGGKHALVSVVFHAINTVLLFFALRRATRRMWPSAIVAALFALHPLHVESVAWISERKDVLSAFFWMLTLWCYLRYCERRTLRNYMLVLLAFALGVLSKQMVVTLPFVLLLLDYWPLGRLRFGLAEGTIESRFGGKLSFFALLKEKAPLFALAIIGSVTIYLVQRSAGAITSRELFPIGARFSNAIVSYIVYLRKTLWPVDLAIFYPHPGASLQAWEIGGAVLVVGVISAFAFWNVRRFPYLTVGWLWYLGCLVPVLGLVQVGMQARADRYTYIPLIGIFIMISW